MTNRTHYGFLNWQDAIAGLSITALLLPQALAYASIGSLPAEAGVIALLVGLFFYGVLGSSRFALVSPTSSSAVILAAVIATMGGDNASLRIMVASGLVCVTGLIFIIASMTRMGNITDFIARPVLRGFTFGLAIVIIFKQLIIVFDINSKYENLFYLVPDIIRQAGDWNYVSLSISIISLAILFSFGQIKRKIPTGAIVILLGIAATKWLDLPAYGIETVGAIYLSPTIPSIPSLTYSEYLQLFELSLAMVFILYAESYSSIRTYAMKHGDTISPNRDLLALGICNLVSGFFRGMPVGAGYSATAANEAYGARTRLAGIFALLITLVLLLTMLSAIELIPQPVLAAIVIHAMCGALLPSSFKRYFIWRTDRLIAVFAVLAVLILGVLHGLVVAICVSILMMLRQISSSSISILGRLGNSHDFVSLSAFPEAKTINGIVILRPDQGLFFANAERILLQARQIINISSTEIHTVILTLDQSIDLDSTSLEALHDFFLYLQEHEKKLILARLKDPVHGILQFTLGATFPYVSMSRLSVDRAVRLARVINNLR